MSPSSEKSANLPEQKPEAAGDSRVAFDHIALATHRIAEATPFLVGELGGVSGFGGPSGPYRWWHWDYAGGGRIEVLEPDGPPGGFLHRFLDRNGPGIHHVTFKLPSLRAACSRAEKLGYTIVGYDDRNPNWNEAFLHPKQAMGIVVQMVESRPHADGEFPQIMEPPPMPASPPPAVVVLGIQMRTDNRERALQQWAGLLEGELEELPDELRFTWPGSSMRVAVAVERGAESFSEAIEVSAGRGLNLPAEVHPELHTRFVQPAVQGSMGKAHQA